MNKKELEKIKNKALEEHIPIIMDETLEVIEKYLEKNRPKRFLEIGAAVRIFCNLFYRIFSRKWQDRYYWKGKGKNRTSKRKL